MINKIYEKIKEFIKLNYKFLLFLLFICFLFTYELPYVVYTPGGIVPLEKRIKIDNEKTSEGSLNMSYVSLRKGTIPVVLLSYVVPNWDLKKEKDVASSNSSVDDLIRLEKIYMQTSIDNATLVAYQKAGKSVDIKSSSNHVVYIDKKSNTDIQKYDVLVSAEEEKIEDINDLRSIINQHQAEDNIKLQVLRNGKKRNCTAKIYDDNGTLKIGIAFITTYEYNTDPKISIKTKSSESGSSGGLMLALAIYNKLNDDNITKGYKVVGTGTIEKDGKVGAIDGVKYKLLGASKNHGDIFLCPKENLEEAKKVKEKYNLSIPVFGVSTFDEALSILENFK